MNGKQGDPDHRLFIKFRNSATRTDIYKGSFFPQTIGDWNALLDSIITSAEDGMARFTSLVRAKDFNISQVLVNECH